MKKRRRIPVTTRMVPALNSALYLSLLFLASLVAVGCHRDPNVQKQKFLQQGNQAFDKGDYSAASIYFSRAIQVDPRFVDAHFRLAQTYSKMGSWPSAYQELRRTVELQPDNWQAQLELGQIELAGGRRQDAKDRALAILKSVPTNSDAQILLSNADLGLGNPA